METTFFLFWRRLKQLIQVNYEKLNAFMQRVLPIVNSGGKPDMAQLAKQVYLPESIAWETDDQVIEKYKRINNNIDPLKKTLTNRTSYKSYNV